MKLFSKRAFYRSQYRIMYKHMANKFGEDFTKNKDAIKRVKEAAKKIAYRM